jgi:hypothetical protein
MKWLLFSSAVLWAGVILLGRGGDHADVMGMLTFIGYLVLDKLDGLRRA